MPVYPKEYKKLVLDDIRANKGLAKPVKAGLAERLFVREVSVSRLHPNPHDEFCNAQIGPNYDIIERYEIDFRRVPPVEPEKLSVEKISTGGYMLLDGHHRWYACRRIGRKTIPVKIMNVTPVETLLSKIRSSESKVCVSFDLDEVLLTDGKTFPAHTRVPRWLGRLLGTQLRLNSPNLIQELKGMGFDVWVYTGQYRSEHLMDALFRLNRVKVSGMVNGYRSKETRSTLRQAFSDNFRYSVHIDNMGIICVDTQQKTVETVDISHTDGRWASEVLSAVKKLPCLFSGGNGEAREK